MVIEICGLKSGPGAGKHASAMNFANEVKQKGNKTMPVYMLMEARVRNQTTYTRYVEGLSTILADYGGRYLVRGGRTIPLNEGLKPERRQPGLFIILEFPSEVSLRRCLTSNEYRKILPLCDEGAETRTFLLKGEIP